MRNDQQNTGRRTNYALIALLTFLFIYAAWILYRYGLP